MSNVSISIDGVYGVVFASSGFVIIAFKVERADLKPPGLGAGICHESCCC